MKNQIRQNCRLFSIRPAVLLFLILMLCGTCFREQAAAESNILTDKVVMRGVDVSRWQGKINWAAVRKAGIRFVMIGMGRVASDGSASLDSYFKYNIQSANENGILVGVYLYSTAATKAHARKEAEWVLRQIQGYKISMPVAFDMELPSIQHLSKKQKTDIALEFLTIIKEAGYYPMMYASENWFYEGINLKRIRQYDKWVARWSEGMTFNPVSIWQYSSKGRVKGISTIVDLDYCYKDYQKIVKPRFYAKNSASIKKGWHTSGTDTFYVSRTGKVLTRRFLKIGKKTYYLDKNGNRASGWKKIKKAWYYFNEDGIMQTCWITVDDRLYYLSPSTGERLEGWQTIKGKTYYLDPEEKGAAALQWKEIDGDWYYFHKKNGRMYKDCTHKGYDFDENGVCTNYDGE